LRVASRDAVTEPKPSPIAFFEKPFQKVAAGEMARILAGIGFDGVEATVRPGGRIEPARVEELLPALVEELRASGLTIPVLATEIGRVDEPHAEATLRVASKLGLRTYRLGGESYDLKKPLIPQLNELRSRWKELAALNAELGLTAVYQNHAGGNRVGAAVWDLHEALEGIDPDAIGVAYDIRHAMVEGMSAWPIGFELLKPRIRVVYVKDFRFDGARAKNVPMGEGVVGKAFYQRLAASGLRVPVSLHCPHLPGLNSENQADVTNAVRTDLAVLKGFLKQA
jgi:sugar phosphate isomerase/epimerase